MVGGRTKKTQAGGYGMTPVPCLRLLIGIEAVCNESTNTSLPYKAGLSNKLGPGVLYTPQAGADSCADSRTTTTSKRVACCLLDELLPILLRS